MNDLEIKTLNPNHSVGVDVDVDVVVARTSSAVAVVVVVVAVVAAVAAAVESVFERWHCSEPCFVPHPSSQWKEQSLTSWCHNHVNYE